MLSKCEFEKVQEITVPLADSTSCIFYERLFLEFSLIVKSTPGHLKLQLLELELRFSEFYLQIYYRWDLEKQEQCGVVAHERLTKPPITMEWLLAKPRSLWNFPAFLDLNGLNH